jgi:hypothetical protein
MEHGMTKTNHHIIKETADICAPCSVLESVVSGNKNPRTWFTLKSLAKMVVTGSSS